MTLRSHSRRALRRAEEVLLLAAQVRALGVVLGVPLLGTAFPAHFVG